jgi:hypothetical protein
MHARQVLDQRRSTLAGLLATPHGPLGPNAGQLGERLRGTWELELRLVERLLAETPGDDVLATIAAWRSRTEAFVARSAPSRTAWTDRSGVVWNGPDVLAVLADLDDRVRRWLGEEHEQTPGG